MYAMVLIFWKAIESLVYDGGLANAGNLALSLLLSLFPFMILLAAILNFWGEPELLAQILTLVFDHWPAGSAQPIAEQMKVVLEQARGQLLTIGNLIALVLATNGIESARDGLNRAYGFTETRNYLWRRVQGTGFIVGAVVALIVSAIILVGTPVAWQFLVTRLDWLAAFGFSVGLVQYGVAFFLLWFALFSFHYFLPDGGLKFGDVIWGILVSIAGIIIGSAGFAYYLKNFANYTNLYAGLAGVMIAIVYLYYLSVLILFGAEFNAALRKWRAGKLGWK